ncbi:type IV pilus assembly protein PilX [Pseudoxanthomonas sp. GM95]|uniref:pilus assembly PilX family protein n=1 Tax=Pseudoxanthomonas sp. GM95 TaxID=1881043 RepID=UPI0008C7A53B|nr:PilX N-terminal domain-containing pilus assembly protein [Pseudoxanthomonas sp. GM95]SEK68836.1 type IV pilus assembly protein PilX [Pseudoxanthomonas sp. GM95]
MRNTMQSMDRQRGAVLYVALVMLILLAMIGIAGMQVTSLQEKMSGNYRNTNLAFQNAEARARNVETLIQVAVNAGNAYVSNQEVCSPSFDPATWADGIATDTASYTRRLDRCFPASSLKIGEKLSEDTGNIYEITSLDIDDAANPGASAVIDTVFIP